MTGRLLSHPMRHPLQPRRAVDDSLPSLLVRKRYIGDYNHAILSSRASGTGNSARSAVYADGSRRRWISAAIENGRVPSGQDGLGKALG